MTYAQLAQLAADQERGALVLARPDGRRLEVKSLPDFGLTNLTARYQGGSSVATCTTQVETLRTVRQWYEGAIDHRFYPKGA